uniref:4Fe-4S dicluster domain-containing protein n=1 Tax=Eiseniibacteriota bacterium TaxID=2212470 RepID=A0A832I1V3_UNCEI
MSDSTVFQRRDFLKLVGLGVAGTAAGCAQPPANQLLPYLNAPVDVLPGVPVWYASTCRECPTGCGVVLKAREGRIIKIEGAPDHPVNRGGLCARGQAALQGLYDPDRVRTPLLREGPVWKPIGWDEALTLAGSKLADAVRVGAGVALLTDHATGSFAALAREFAAAAGGTHLAWEPFAHESLREANRRTFGVAEVPNVDFAAARMIVSFGADFLETWLNPTGHARDFAAAREPGRMAHVVAVGPRLSLTGSNADEWVAVRPGGEMALALGMARVILTENLGPGVAERGALLEAVAAWTPEAAAAAADVPAETVVHMARHFASAAPSLAVAGGIAAQSEQSVALCAAVNLLNHVAGNVGRTVRFDRTPNWDGAATFGDLQRLIADMAAGKVDVLFVHRANPAYATPAWAGWSEAMQRVSFKVSLSGVLDETAALCDLLLPSTHAIESWDDAEPARGVWSMVQPGMQRVATFDARPAGDILMGVGRAAGLGAAWPETWLDYLKGRWRALQARFGAGQDWDTFWAGVLQRGGVWEDVPARPVRWTGTPAFAAPELRGAGDFALVVHPSPNLYDGRGANKAWLQELPDPVSKAVWGTWVEIHPDAAKRLGIGQGDPVRVETEAGALEAPAYLYAGLRPDTIAVALGQGHGEYGRYARGLGANALALLPPAQDAASGAVAYLSAKAKVTRGTAAAPLAMTQRVKQQQGRGVAQLIPLTALGAGAGGHGDRAAGGHGATGAAPGHGHGRGDHEGWGHHAEYPMSDRPGRHTEPRAKDPGEKVPAHAITAFESNEKARGPRQAPVNVGSYKHAKHRWAMAIDLNACTGCSACVVGCTAENNVPTVGPALVQRGRDMSWIRIERWEEKIGGADHRTDVRHIPMMCQHCNDAPCETVCPVYATYHNPEGLNAQVYNRCVGTRYCSNNCPYKVRAFNWFDYGAPEKATFAFPEPLNWQLNPDVTVRSKGVMEKCTMCIQRILEVKGHARDEGRDPRDGELQTACSQSCPTQAITVGDLADPESRVSRLSRGSERRYWVFNELNTKPGVTYLKKVGWAAGEEAHG